MNVMRHKFTVRETVLLLILLVILAVGLYFLLVFYPLQNRISEIEAKKEEVALENDVADARLAIYNRMKDELDEIEKLPANKRTRMYKYSDKEKEEIINLMYSVFGDNVQNLSYTENQNGNILELVISFSFKLETSAGTAEDTFATYENGKQILYDLANTGRRSQISNLSVSAEKGNIAEDNLTISGIITFYELA